MDPRKLEGQDERLLGVCAYCGGTPNTRDHVPSRVLLDEPFPDQLRVVDACFACNNSFSADERYVACMIECAISGTVDPCKVGRSKIGRILSENPDLVALIAACRRDSDPPMWAPDVRRVHNVVAKLAQGHAAWEVTLPALGEPTKMQIVPLVAMTDAERESFESPSAGYLLPELGSRAFYRAIAGKDLAWSIVQDERYRYSVDQDAGLRVRLVLSEYLAATVTWE